MHHIYPDDEIREPVAIPSDLSLTDGGVGADDDSVEEENSGGHRQERRHHLSRSRSD